MNNSNIPSLGNQLASAPKQFCDNINGGFNEESFLVAMFSGQAATVFALTPAHMKKFAQWTNLQVSNFEKQYGEIKAELNLNIPSPIQASNLRNDEE